MLKYKESYFGGGKSCLCERCGLADAVNLVTSDIIHLLVCNECAIVASNLRCGESTSGKIEVLLRPWMNNSEPRKGDLYVD